MEDLFNEAFHTIFSAAAAAVATALVALIVQLFRKAGIDLDEAKRAQMRSVAQEAILSQEEQARAMVKAKLPKPPAVEMFRGAIADVIDKIPGITFDEAGKLVNAELPKVRAATVDFSTAVLKAATNKGGRK